MTSLKKKMAAILFQFLIPHILLTKDVLDVLSVYSSASAFKKDMKSYMGKVDSCMVKINFIFCRSIVWIVANFCTKASVMAAG